MHDNPAYLASQKLLRCQVVNRYRESSVRYVEIDAFRLWEFLMTERHGLQVGEPELCLWLHEGEYARNANVFEHAGDAEPVNRILVDLFDDAYGFSQAITRYVPAAETDRVAGILRSHLPADVRDTDACRIDVAPGRVVHQAQPRATRQMLIGLQG